MGRGRQEWIKGAIKRPGSLRSELHAKKGHNIPAERLEKAAHSSNSSLKRKAVLAQTLKGFHK